MLFVGDSTIEEQALLFAHSAGYALAELHTTCFTGGSRYREFDASGKGVEISVRWSASSTCEGNVEGLPHPPAWPVCVNMSTC